MIADIRQIYLALLLILIYGTVTQYFFHTVCPWLILTGMSCPACGLTRAGILLLSGRFVNAWRMNPSIYIWAPFLSYLFLGRYLFQKKLTMALPLGTAAGMATIAIHIARALRVG